MHGNAPRYQLSKNMTKEHLSLLLQLCDLAHKTGQIPFEAMSAIAGAVSTAQSAFNQMHDDDLLTIRHSNSPAKDLPATAKEVGR